MARPANRVAPTACAAAADPPVVQATVALAQTQAASTRVIDACGVRNSTTGRAGTQTRGAAYRQAAQVVQASVAATISASLRTGSRDDAIEISRNATASAMPKPATIDGTSPSTTAHAAANAT
ncbi:MAG: hypothetical protein EOP70_00795 [Variovorax sp.]|nr:MAG: hypothetical protein EOP70_00795 [Variovorax sp.]